METAFRIQLFCIPFAGGSASFFNAMRKYLLPDIEMIPIEYAGRGNRRREAYSKTFQNMVTDVSGKIKLRRKEDLPYAIFGYSMGSLVAYECCLQYLQEDAPIHLFVASHKPPHLPIQVKLQNDTNEEEFLELIRKFGGLDERIIENKRFLDLYMQPTWQDYQLLSQYDYQAEHVILPCDITAFFSQEDISKEDMGQWSRYAQEKFELYDFSGNHFFIKQHMEEVVEILNHKLLQ